MMFVRFREGTQFPSNPHTARHALGSDEPLTDLRVYPQQNR